jgi:tetratricopeptide (TPR) repeat protein/tRNA A-37 threonylcarbamoyl transferase component Bud32
MTPERWQQVKDVLQEALAQPAAERRAFLARIAADDAELVREVDSLLTAHDEAGNFIVTPALARADASSLIEELHRTSKWSGRRVGPYLLVREIAHGGMGAVYLATRADDEYQKKVAIKVVRSSFDPAYIEQRFRHERQILADLDHPNIARLIDGGSTEDGSPYFVMEYVDGLPIDQYCEANGLTTDARLMLFRDVCAAVHYAHQHLVVHRDLKPNNILVTTDGVPKLLDFGIAKLLTVDAHAPDHTVTAMRVMTLESASPEQVRGETVTTATDVYALGVMLHRLLTGHGPYEAATPSSHDLARAICEEDPRRPSDVATEAGLARRLRGDLDTIALKALQKDPSRRYSTVEQFAEDITRHLDGLPVLARPDTVRYRTTKFITRHKAGVAAAGLFAVALVGGAVATAWQAHVAGVQRSRAERRFNDVRRLANSFLFEFHDAIQNLPGSTKARELVVLRATEYLDGLSSESAHDEGLERELAAAYDKVGDVQGLPQFANLGDTPGALRSHRSAVTLREGLAARNPLDADIQRDLKTTYDHLSAILAVKGDSRAAADYQAKALAIAEALYARNPGGTAERRSLATAYHTAGDRTSSQGDFVGALAKFKRELSLFETLLASDPASAREQRNVGLAHKKVGAVLEKLGDRTAALDNYRKAVALDEVRASAYPNDGQAKLDLSFGYASIGFALSTAGDIAGALENYQRALASREQVAAADPHDVNAKDAVARAHISIGHVLRKDGRLNESIEHFRHALESASDRYAADPTNGGAAERLANVHAALADSYARRASAATGPIEAMRRWQEARASSTKSLGIWTERRAKGPLSTISQSELDGLVELIATSDRELARLTANVRK